MPPLSQSTARPPVGGVVSVDDPTIWPFPLIASAIPAVPPSVGSAVRTPFCQTNARLPAYPTACPASLTSLACALWTVPKIPRSVTAYGPGGVAARGARVTIDGSNNSANIATSGLRMKVPSHKGPQLRGQASCRTRARKTRHWVRPLDAKKEDPLTADVKSYALGKGVD